LIWLNQISLLKTLANPIGYFDKHRSAFFTPLPQTPKVDCLLYDYRDEKIILMRGYANIEPYKLSHDPVIPHGFIFVGGQ
jgi:hypothetical protein